MNYKMNALRVKKTLLPIMLLTTTLLAAEDMHQHEKGTLENSKFIPDISIIMDASYVHTNIESDEVSHLKIPGITFGTDASHLHNTDSHTSYNNNNGFSLNYAELLFSSSVDSFFTMEGIFHFSQNVTEIEEFYFTSTTLGDDTKIKGGKFKSNFGYLNDQHRHVWNFADMPLVYESFLGMHGINEVGVQLQWIAPTDTYLMLGIELLQGENENMFGYSSIHLDDLNASNPNIKAKESPSLFITYLKTSFDLGDTTVFGGISYAKGSSSVNNSEGEEEPHAFSGDSKLYGAHLIVKHNFALDSFLTLQTELLSREIEGILYLIDENTKFATLNDLTKKQSGLYTQLIYAYDNNLKIGLRYETIYQNDGIRNSINQNEATNLSKYSAMIEYNTSAFAKFRLQYNHNNALYNEDGVGQNINTIIVQANISIGSHKEH